MCPSPQRFEGLFCFVVIVREDSNAQCGEECRFRVAIFSCYISYLS